MKDPKLYNDESADLRNDFNSNDELEEFNEDYGYLQINNRRSNGLWSK